MWVIPVLWLHPFISLLLTLKWQMSARSTLCMMIKRKRTKGESRPPFDLHVSHKTIMDSINLIPGGKRASPQNHGEWSKPESERGTTAVPAACPLPPPRAVTPAGARERICPPPGAAAPYHPARALGLFNPLNRVEALCWRGPSWCVLPR